MADKGSITARLDGNRIIVDWTSDSGGDVDVAAGIAETLDAYSDITNPKKDRIQGSLKCVETIPGLNGNLTDNLPTASYDITVSDEYGMDICGGSLADRSGTVAERKYPDAEIVIDSELTLAVSNAGNATKGRVIFTIEPLAGYDPVPSPSASDTIAGVVELATDSETSAGTDTERAVSPAGLASVYQYQTLYIPASAMTPATTNGAAAGTLETSSNKLNMDYLAFDGATEEFGHFQVVMPKGWDRGTVKFRLRWTSATGSTAGDTVEWKVAGVAISDNDALDAAVGTSQVISDTLLADNGANLQVTGATPALTIGGTPALGDTIHFVVSRNVGGTDDMTEDAWLLGAVLEYKLTETVTAD